MEVDTAPSVAQPTVIVVFVDMRGFSEWSRDIDAYQNTPELIGGFRELVRRRFGDFPAIKLLGDGAMLVKSSKSETVQQIGRELTDMLRSITAFEREFAKLVARLDVKRGSRSELLLGWGITRGTVIELPLDGQFDYLGAQVNKAARLCEMARPFGIVVDQDDFPAPPRDVARVFFPQVRRLPKPNQDVHVWVTKEIFNQFQSREVLRETPEVHVAGICVRDSGREILLARRNADRRLFPNKWEGCGGQLRRSEGFANGVERHYRTEMEVNVTVVGDIAPELYEIVSPDVPLIPGLRFICDYKDGHPHSPNHSALQWTSVNAFRAMEEHDFPPGFQAQASALISRYEQRRA